MNDGARAQGGYVGSGVRENTSLSGGVERRAIRRGTSSVFHGDVSPGSGWSLPTEQIAPANFLAINPGNIRLFPVMFSIAGKGVVRVMGKVYTGKKAG